MNLRILAFFLLAPFPCSAADVPPIVKKMEDIYEAQRKNIEIQGVRNYLAALQELQTTYAANKEYDKVALIQKEVRRVSAMSAEEAISTLIGGTAKLTTLLAGNWKCISGADKGVVFTIRPNGTVGKGFKRNALWMEGKVYVKTYQHFLFLDEGLQKIYARGYMIDRNTFSIRWQGCDNIYKRQ